MVADSTVGAARDGGASVPAARGREVQCRVGLERRVFATDRLRHARPAVGCGPSHALAPDAPAQVGIGNQRRDAFGERPDVALGVTGFPVPESDVGALAERIAALIADPDLRWRIGREGVRWAAAHRWPCVAEAICREYASLEPNATLHLAAARCRD